MENKLKPRIKDMSNLITDNSIENNLAFIIMGTLGLWPWYYATKLLLVPSSPFGPDILWQFEVAPIFTALTVLSLVLYPIVVLGIWYMTYKQFRPK